MVYYMLGRLSPMGQKLTHQDVACLPCMEPPSDQEEMISYIGWASLKILAGSLCGG